MSFITFGECQSANKNNYLLFDHENNIINDLSSGKISELHIFLQILVYQPDSRRLGVVDKQNKG